MNDERIKKTIQLTKEGYSEDLIEIMLESPEAEASIRAQIKRERAAAKQNDQHMQLLEMKSMLAEIENRPEKGPMEFTQIIGLKRRICDLQQLIMQTGD